MPDGGEYPTCRACRGRGFYRPLLTPWNKRGCRSCSGLGHWLADSDGLPRVRSYDRDGTPYDEVVRTKSGKIVTEEDIARWAEEAEEGYDDPT